MMRRKFKYRAIIQIDKEKRTFSDGWIEFDCKKKRSKKKIRKDIKKLLVEDVNFHNHLFLNHKEDIFPMLAFEEIKDAGIVHEAESQLIVSKEMNEKLSEISNEDLQSICKEEKEKIIKEENENNKKHI